MDLVCAATSSAGIWWADFSLSMTALREFFLPLAVLPDDLFESWLDEDASSRASDDGSNADVRSICFNLTEDFASFGLFPDENFIDRSRSFSLRPSRLDDVFEDDFSLFEFGELAADFNADILGLPEPPEVVGCLGDDVPN